MPLNLILFVVFFGLALWAPEEFKRADDGLTTINGLWCRNASFPQTGNDAGKDGFSFLPCIDPSAQPNKLDPSKELMP